MFNFGKIKGQEDGKHFLSEPSTIKPGTVAVGITALVLALLVGGSLAIHYTVGFSHAFHWIVDTHISLTVGKICLYLVLPAMGGLVVVEGIFRIVTSCKVRLANQAFEEKQRKIDPPEEYISLQ